ncbi:MAG: spore gernimation protein [Oscillospiraceae bacterium]|nr:spore gernimation protein [Oscillospiraceae bacterium]
MSRDKLSMRQIMVIVCGGLISPATLLLPQMTAKRAGASGWWSPMLAMLALLLMGWCVTVLFRDTKLGTGLAQIMTEVTGKWPARVLLACYLVWGMFLLGLFTRVASSRLSDAYQTNGTLTFCVLLLAMVLWMAIGKVSAFGRAGEIFYLALAITFGAIVLFCLFKVRWDFAMPQNRMDFSKGLSAAFPVLGVASMGIYGGFLGGLVKRSRENRQRGFGWLVVSCIAFTLLLLVVTGRVGSVLEARLNIPFITLVEDIGVKGAFQRMEALVGAIWVLSDLILLGMLALSCRSLTVEVIPACGQIERWMAIPTVAVGAALAIFLPERIEENSFLWSIVLGGNLTLGIAVPIFVLFAAKLRRMR